MYTVVLISTYTCHRCAKWHSFLKVKILEKCYTREEAINCVKGWFKATPFQKDKIQIINQNDVWINYKIDDPPFKGDDYHIIACKGKVKEISKCPYEKATKRE